MLVTKLNNTLHLSAVDRKATALGLTVGQTLADARAMLPALKVVTANDPADLKLLAQIADWCGRFTPLVALDGPRNLLLDVTGASHLFDGEQEMLNRIRADLCAQGFAVRGALAGTAVAARALARYRDGAVVAPGEEEKMMGPLPVEALGLGSVKTHALRRAGLKTVRQIAARKRSELVARLGAGMLAVLDEALGHSSKPISPLKPLPDYWQEQNFAEPVATEDVIHSALKSLTGGLTKTLERHGEGARRIEATFFRADGTVRCIAVETGTPTRDPAIIERLFHERLGTLSDPLDPGFGFDLIRLSAARVERIRIEAVSLDARGNDKSELGFLIDRLSTRFGRHRVLAFQPHDTHVPEEAWVTVPAQHAQPSKLPWEQARKTGDAPRRPLRLFARPEQVDFTATRHFIWRKADHTVLRHAGPERIAMEWWRHEISQPQRDYFRVEDTAGRRYWLYRNDQTSQWLLHGVFA